MSATVDSLVKTILKSGSSAGEVTRQLSWVKDANAVGKRGVTPLIAAIESEDDEIISVLLDSKKVDVNARDAVMVLPPIVHAVRHGGGALLPLIKKGADLKVTDEAGDNVAHWACRLNEPSAVTLLGKSSPSIFTATDDEGNTPLHVALLEGQQEAAFAVLDPDLGLVEVLDLNSKNDLGETPLVLAVKGRMGNVVQSLIDTGKIDIDVADEDGNTALHIAVKNNMTAVERLLLAVGADGSICNKAGLTPQGLAKEAIEQIKANQQLKEEQRHEKEERKAQKLEVEKDHSELTAFLRDHGLEELVDILFARKFKYVAEVERLTDRDLRRMGVKDGGQREGFLTAVEKHFEKIAEAERAAEEERLREAERRARPASKVTAVLAFVGVFVAIYICLRIIIYNRTTGGLYRLTYPDAGLGDL